MADSKLSDLTADTSPSSDDLIYTVNDPGGTPADRKVTLGNLGPALVLFARKTADETVTSSTALQNDDHLAVALQASSVYEFEAVLFYDASTAGDIKVAFTVPAGATILWGEIGLAPGSATNPGSATFATAAASGTAAGGVGGVGAGTKLMLRARGLVVVDTTAGNLQTQWAQQTSDGTATTVFINSFLRASKVA